MNFVSRFTKTKGTKNLKYRLLHIRVVRYASIFIHVHISLVSDNRGKIQNALASKV